MANQTEYKEKRSSNLSCLSRRSILKGASVMTFGSVVGVLGSPSIVRSAQEKKFSRPLVAGIGAKEGDPTFIALSEIPRILREKYDVEIDIQIHPSSMLGTTQSQLEAVQTGFIDLTSESSATFGQFTDSWQFLDLPYVITGWDMAQRFFDSDIFKERSAHMEAKMPVKVLPALSAGGYRVLWNNVKQVKTPDALSGLKLRSTKSPADIALIKAWGGNPTPIAWTESYTSLQQGVVEGIYLQPIWAYLFNFHEVLRHGTDMEANFVSQIQVMNINTWNSFPDQIKEPFILAAREAALLGTTKDRELEGQYKKKLAASGIEMYKPTSKELRDWKERGNSIWEQFGTEQELLSKLRTLQL